MQGSGVTDPGNGWRVSGEEHKVESDGGEGATYGV